MASESNESEWRSWFVLLVSCSVRSIVATKEGAPPPRERAEEGVGIGDDCLIFGSQLAVFAAKLSSQPLTKIIFQMPSLPPFPPNNDDSGITSTVFGSTGFLGRYVVNHIAKSGSRMILPTRCNENARQHLKVMGDLGQIVNLDYNIRDRDAIKYAVERSNVVVRRGETRGDEGREDVYYI